MNELEQLKQQIEELRQELHLLRFSTSIPHDVEQALRARLEINEIRDNIIESQTGKLASSEDQAVNEGGSSTYNVLKSPDGFDQFEVDGVTHYYPYYT